MLLWAIFMAGFACTHGFENRIIDGIATTIEDIPYQCSMVLKNEEEGTFELCGCSILNEYFFLTAAHCTDKTTASQWKIRVGSSFYNKEGLVISPTRIIQHREYNIKNCIDNDISMLESRTKLTSSASIAFVKLPFQGQITPDGAILRVSGWGRTSENGPFATQILKANLTVINQNVCKNELILINNVTDEMICGGSVDGEESACHGDSGGPATSVSQDGIQVGIVSWGKDCVTPTVFTRVSNYVDWININMMSVIIEDIFT